MQHFKVYTKIMGKKMKNGYKLGLAAIAASISLVGCGSDSDSTTTAVVAETVTGQFVDTYVAGLNYTCSSGRTGITNDIGEYTCNVGDTVEFSLGGYLLGSVTASSGIVTPEALYPDNPEAALNVAQVIQSLDADPTDDIITIPENFTGLDDVTTTPEDENFDALIEDVLDVPLVTEEEAQAHLDETELMILLGGKTLYDVGQQVSDARDIWIGEVTFNADLTELSYTGSESTEAEIVPISVTGDRLVFGDDTDGSYTVIGENKGDYIEVTDHYSDGTIESNTRLYFDKTKADAYYDSLQSDLAASTEFTQERVSESVWFVVEYEEDTNIAYCNGVFDYDGASTLTVAWSENGVNDSTTVPYSIVDGKVITSHDGKTETETLLSNDNDGLTTSKTVIYDDGSTPPPAGSKKWFTTQSSAEAFLATYTNPEAGSCFTILN